MTRPLYINGRILLRPHGGVRRYASEVASRLPESVILQPPRAAHPWSARRWEQQALADATHNGVLLNMAHSGPASHPRHVAVVHDLFALSTTQRLNPAFVQRARRHMPALIRSARKVICVSQPVADDVMRAFSLPSQRIAIVEPGISEVFQRGDKTAARLELQLEVDRPVVAALLDPTPRKQSHQVVKLLHEVADLVPEAQIVVAGAHSVAPFGRQLRQPAIDRGQFTDLGNPCDARLATMYQSADVFVSLSEGEGFGLAPAEAGACGAAVVTTAVPSIANHCAESAVIVTDSSTAALAVQRLIQHPARCAALAEAASTALASVRWQRTAQELDTHLQEVQAA